MHTQRDNYSGGCAGLAAGTGAGTIKTVNALPYAIAGRAYQKAATDNIALAVMTESPAKAVVPIPASSSGCFFIMVDAAGAITFKQAKNQLGATAAGYSPGAFEWPQDYPGQACIGAMKIVTSASGAFTAGTTALNATGVTPTFYNVMDDLGVPVPY